MLPGEDAAWPARPRTDKDNPVDPDPTYARRLGYRFGGYEFDADGLPRLLYESSGVSVVDQGERVEIEGGSLLRRSLTLTAQAPTTLTLRALTGALEQRAEHVYARGRLELRLPDLPHRLRPLPAADPEGASESELLLELALPAGTTTVSLDYALLD